MITGANTFPAGVMGFGASEKESPTFGAATPSHGAGTARGPRDQATGATEVSRHAPSSGPFDFSLTMDVVGKGKIWWQTTTEVLALPAALACLSDDELRVARQLRLASDQERFLAGRVTLRYALSHAVDGMIAPGHWRYRNGPHGKPMLEVGYPRLHFNLSHAGACVAVGVSKSGPIGVDVEELTASDGREIVDDVLTEHERACLSQSPPGERWVTFVRFWTAKEACAKALGLGLAVDFRTIEVSLDPEAGLLHDGRAGRVIDFSVTTRIALCAGRFYCLSAARPARWGWRGSGKSVQAES